MPQIAFLRSRQTLRRITAPERIRFAGVVLLLMLCLSIQPAQAVNRAALVIGNASYDFAPLNNPLHDAEDMANALKHAGFQVTLLENASQPDMREAVNTFANSLAQDDIALLYFSGHGVQIKDHNYLIPVGVTLTSQSDVAAQAIDMEQVLASIIRSGSGASILVLDACRNNPLPAATRSLTKGLARQTSTSPGAFISYSTSPGSVALDGEGRNSPYTKNLVAAINMPGLNLEETFKHTLKAVHQETRGAQTPWISSSFFGDFIFNEQPASAGSAVPRRPQEVVTAGDLSSASRQSIHTAASHPEVVSGMYQVRGSNPNGSHYSGAAYLSRIGDSWRFEWLIAGQTFVGIGEFVGDKLSIEWGDSEPVVYDVVRKGVLDGRWGKNGKGTDVLTWQGLESVVSSAPGDASGNLAGNYRVTGANPDGSHYEGRVAITQQGDSYHVQWWIGTQTYSGAGKLDHRLLTVDWGAAEPVIYQVMDDGLLKGTWAGGKAREDLRRE